MEGSWGSEAPSYRWYKKLEDFAHSITLFASGNNTVYGASQQPTAIQNFMYSLIIFHAGNPGVGNANVPEGYYDEDGVYWKYNSDDGLYYNTSYEYHEDSESLQEVVIYGEHINDGGQNGSRSDGNGFAYILIMHDKTGALGAGHTAMGVVLSDGTVRYLSKDGFDILNEKGENTNFSDEPRSGLNTLLNSPNTERYTEFISIGMTDKQAISIMTEMKSQIRTHYDLWYAHCMTAISTSLFLNSASQPGFRELPGFNPGYSLYMKTPNWQFNHAKQYYDYFSR